MRENLVVEHSPTDRVYITVYPSSGYACIESNEDGYDYAHLHVDLDQLIRALREGGANL